MQQESAQFASATFSVNNLCLLAGIEWGAENPLLRVRTGSYGSRAPVECTTVWHRVRAGQGPTHSTLPGIYDHNRTPRMNHECTTKAAGNTFHPRHDDHDKPVLLKKPCKPSALATWSNSNEVAIVIPDGVMPPALGGIPFAPWTEAPETLDGWCKLGSAALPEPEFSKPAGKNAAAGVVVVEEDGRVWAVSPSNQFGGYETTFPKGTLENGLDLQTSAVKEAFEEAGLQVQLLAYLVDVERTTSYTRYYLARRIGGTPADMGWESQAVLLIPRDELALRLTHKNDAPVIAALGSASVI